MRESDVIRQRMAAGERVVTELTGMAARLAATMQELEAAYLRGQATVPIAAARTARKALRDARKAVLSENRMRRAQLDLALRREKELDAPVKRR